MYMRRLVYLWCLLSLIITSCSKKGNDTGDIMSPEEQQAYENVLAVQEEAAVRFEELLLTLDTASALTQLREYFLQNAAVTSAEVGEQGIAVEYTNGMIGGIFVDPRDYPEPESVKSVPKAVPYPVYPLKSLVNIQKAIFLNPSYWERTQYANQITQQYATWLPKPTFALSKVYKNQEASVDKFKNLAGYGLIHVYSHGWAYPKEDNFTDIYLLTGEVASIAGTLAYWPDIKKRMVIITMTKNASGWKNIYWITRDFIATHNDFSKDTLLFYGGFCYSFLGKWPTLTEKFGNGTYMGFSWYVRTSRNAAWAISLVDSLCDTAATYPYTVSRWLGGAKPDKSYFEAKANKTVSIQYAGDESLFFWNFPTAAFDWTPSSMISKTEICKGASVTLKDKSTGGGLPVTGWEWYFYGGTPGYFSGQQPPAIYFNTVGSGTIRLVVSNAYGSGESSVYFSVVPCK